MRLIIAACLMCSCICGCTATPDTQAGTRVEQNEPSVVKTPEIIRILEEEAVVFVATTHSQTIHIRLKDGSQYQGTYVSAESGKYSKDPNLSDILNLVMHIKKHRAPEEVKEWQIMCE